MKLTIKEMAVFGMLGALMYASKMLMELFPNIHLLGTFIIALTLVYRKKALYPIYTFVLITGLFGGFATWWVPYLYIWTVLWAAVMLLPRSIPAKFQPIVYMAVCAAHGFLYGVLYAPAQALLFGFNFTATLAWIAAGLPFDLIHGVSNFFAGALILPLARIIRLAENAHATA
ncbi:MAG: hypothetical protein J6B40_05510 [Oscillospiraceae bacterium]|nr:hypothetical protein [Oscillospiraceae bacterium]